MANIFSKVVAGLEWVEKKLSNVPSWISKVVRLTDDVEADSATLLPKVLTLFSDVDALVVAGVKDSGADLTAAEALAAAIVTAAKADAINIASDEAVVAAFTAFIDEVKDGANYVDVLAGLKKLITDWDAFGAAAKAAIAKIDSDAAAS